ncbi:hypothetical protein KKA14_10155, partial [bacterium]|nr:hypothetical protein [bacterium]
MTSPIPDMEEEIAQPEKEVKIHQLSNDMTITAYTGFSHKYHSMDASICQFLKHNFKGTKVIVTRGPENLNIRISELQVKDTLLQIYDFPPSLKKLTTVNERLIKALKHRGIHQFDINKKVELAEDSKRELREIIELVNESTKRPSKREEKRQEAVRETQELVRKVNESVKVRQNATDSVEQLMDNARRGYTNIDEINKYI